MIWSFSLGICSIFANFHAIYGENGRRDLFLEHMMRFVDDSVEPCENFYRHVCPKTLKEQDLLVSRVFTHAEKLRYAEILRKPDQAELLVTQYHQELLANEDYKLAKMAEEVVNIFEGVRVREAIVTMIKEDELLTLDDYVQVKTELNEMLELLLEQIQKTSSLSRQTREEYRNLAENMIIFTGTANENGLDYDRLYKLLHNMAGHAINNHDVIQGSDPKQMHVVEQIYELFSTLKNFDPIRYHSLLVSSGFNAFTHAEMGVLKVCEVPLLIGKGATLAGKYGGLGSVYGHEMMHGIFRENDEVLDSQILKARDCLVKHSESVCRAYVAEEWTEKGECIDTEDGRFCSCEVTKPEVVIYEHIADQEGIQLAYLALQKKINESGLQQLAYPTVSKLKHVTNERLFFYARAVTSCTLSSQSNYADGDEHPADYVRVNVAMSLSNAFMKAFNCSPDSKMFKLQRESVDNCNQVGDPVRRH